MSKRSAEDDLSGNGSTSHTAIKTNKDSLPTTTNGKEEEPDNMDIGEFEDPYGDEFESDEEIIELDDNNDEEDDDELHGFDTDDNDDRHSAFLDDDDDDGVSENSDAAYPPDIE